MSKELIKQNAADAIERANQLLNSNALIGQIVESNAQAAIVQQTRESILRAQLQTARDSSANEVRRIAEDRARVQQDLLNKTINEQRLLQENEQLKSELAAYLQVAQHEHKQEIVAVPVQSPAHCPDYDTDFEVVSIGELPANTAELD